MPLSYAVRADSLRGQEIATRGMEEASEEFVEALQTFRELAQENPEIYRPNVTKTRQHTRTDIRAGNGLSLQFPTIGCQFLPIWRLSFHAIWHMI